MSYQDERLNALYAQAQQLTNLKRQLRVREKDIDARMRTLKSQPTMASNNVKGLRNSLLGNLPNYMMPGNIGGITEVTWPFYFSINMTMGDDPTISQNTYARGSFQVDQEACFLIMAVSIAYNTNDEDATAIATAPLQVEFIDRQSSRRFNDKPMPIQMIGGDSCPTIFPVPMYMQPNAFLDVQVNGILAQEYDFDGSGSFQFTFFGNRIRNENAGKVLSTIFAPQI
jgi:hypothetical protein